MNKVDDWSALRLRLLESDLEVFQPLLEGDKEDSQVLEEVRGVADQTQASLLAALVRLYLGGKRLEPYYLYMAASYCYAKDIPATPTLWRLICEAAMRHERGHDSPDLRVTINKEIAKRGILNLMLHLIYGGQTLERAASQAARAFPYVFPDVKPYKASSLQREYVKNVRKTSIEDQFFKVWDSIDFNSHGIGAELVRLLPEAEDPGHRR